MSLTIYSKGLYSSWMLDHTDGTLFDCGEGCATHLGNQVFAINRICFGHGHMDHIGGLLTLINIRNTAHGTKDKPLELFYPKGDQHIEGLFPYLNATQPNLKYALKTTALLPGDIIPITDKKHIRAFPTIHHSGLSLGYVVEEHRKKLAPAYAHLTQAQIREGLQNRTINKDKLMTPFEHPTLAYTLDAYKFDTREIEGVETLVLDTTFLADEHETEKNEDGTPKRLRNTLSHATLEEGLQLAIDSKVSKRAILAHFSPRYKPHEIDAAVEAAKRKQKPKFQVIALSNQRKPIDLDLTIPTPNLSL